MNNQISRQTYKQLKNTWLSDRNKEDFFVQYAVRGPMVCPSQGLRSDLPIDYPISGPVKEPSPLNTRWKYALPWPGIDGIL